MKARRCPGFGQHQQVKARAARLDVQRQDAHQGDDAARQQVQRQFHRGVFFARAAPGGNEHVHRKDCQLVKEEQQEQVQRHKDAKHAPRQQQQENKKLARTIRDAPGDHDAGKDDNARQRQHGRVQPVGGDVIADPQPGEPLCRLFKLPAAHAGVIAKIDRQRKRHGEKGKDQRGNPDFCVPLFGDEQDD